MKCINKVAVLGAGVMGSTIAAHFANVGVPVLLLDFPGLAIEGVEKAKKSRPPAFYLNEFSSMIETGDYRRDLKKTRQCDLIIEAIVERMDVKKDFLKKIDKIRRPGAVVATNTSGLSINEMIADCSRDMREHFLGMHFFNPPRYLKLIEIIPGKDTKKEIVDLVSDFSENVLGKGVVVCSDTPGFIANRMGMYFSMLAIKAMAEDGYSVQEIDIATGKIIGHQKSAIFRTADIVGLDTFVHIANNLYENLKEDDEREVFRVPKFIEKLVESGALGVKTNKGFYLKNAEGEIKQLDYKTRRYVPKEKLAFPSISKARQKDSYADRIKIMFAGKDRASKFLWKIFSKAFLYCAKRLDEFSVADIDNAFKWGFGWEIGPFGKWDILGVKETVEKMEKEGRKIPANITEFLMKGGRSFYKSEKGIDYYYDFKSGSYREIKRNKKTVLLSNLKDQNRMIMSNPSTTIIDLGDGVACLEFHTKMNTLNIQIIDMGLKALDKAERNFRGLVIANQGEIFCAGGNLGLFLWAMKGRRWRKFEHETRKFQEMNVRLQRSSIPVVAAPFNISLGGGTEICVRMDQLVASAETYMGLIETRIGLIPAGGGTTEMLWRCMDNVPEDADPLPFVKKVFETIAMSKFSSSAEEARRLGYLRPFDKIIVNSDHLIHHAKQAVINLAESDYKPPRERSILVMGRPGMAALKVFVSSLKEGGFISEHDRTVALKLGHILTGGNISGKQYVSEKYLLDLEIEAFMSLAGMRKTQDRLRYMLEKGKPLRN